MKKFTLLLTILTVAFLPLFAQIEDVKLDPSAAQEGRYEAYSSGFYQDFISAAWYERFGKYEEALEYYIKLQEVLPEDVQILKSLCDVAILTENLEVMNKYIPMLVALAPQDPAVISINATWLWSKGELHAAVSEYEKAINLDPENPEIIFKYITLLAGVDSEKAVEYLKGLSKEYPHMSGAIALQIAELYLKQNDNDGAVGYLKEAVKQNPGMAEGYIGLAKIYEFKGDNASVLEQYLAMDKAGLADSTILTKIGAYYVLDNKKDLSLKYFLRAKELDNGNPIAAQFLVLNAQEKNDFEKAIYYLQDSRDYETNPAYHIRASYFYNRAGNLNAAVEVLANAYDKFGKNLEVGFYYGLALIDLEDYKTAEKVFAEVLSAAPENQMALFHYAFVLERQKKYKPMEQALKDLLKLAPENEQALNFLGYYLVDKTKRTEEGGEYIKKAVSINPGDYAFIDSLAWYYYKKGEVSKALNLLEGLSPEAMDDAEIVLHMAVVYEKLENYLEAKKYYKILLEKEPKNKEGQKGLKRILKKLQ